MKTVCTQTHLHRNIRSGTCQLNMFDYARNYESSHAYTNCKKKKSMSQLILYKVEFKEMKVGIYSQLSDDIFTKNPQKYFKDLLQSQIYCLTLQVEPMKLNLYTFHIPRILISRVGNFRLSTAIYLDLVQNT